MGIFFSIISRLISQKKVARVVMIGLNGAGKTTILYNMKFGDVYKTAPTLGFNVETIHYQNMIFNVWDIGGHEDIRVSWNAYLIEVDVVIFVLDSTDKKSKDILYSEFRRLAQAPELMNAVFLIYANKQDRPDAITTNDVENMLKLSSTFSSSHCWHIEPSCALDGSGIKEGFKWIVQILKERSNANRHHSVKSTLVKSTPVK